MKVNVSSQNLIPCMKDRRKTDCAAQSMLGVSGEFLQGFGYALEEQVEYDLFIAKRNRIQFMRERKDIVKIGNGQQISPSSVQPTSLGQSPALWAMAVAA